mmetsp:Transcript_38465/g.95682  ORF Transcript_38465/g.95682 Transcript_38465/m.95682 type:complete len:86 (+) Transcript_38465:106-363(+)
MDVRLKVLKLGQFFVLGVLAVGLSHLQRTTGIYNQLVLLARELGFFALIAISGRWPAKEIQVSSIVSGYLIENSHLTAEAGRPGR